MRLSRPQRKWLILATLRNFEEDYGPCNGGCTTAQIAKALDMAVSQYLRDMLYELRDEGRLKMMARVHRTLKNGQVIPAYHFFLPHWQPLEQMELFAHQAETEEVDNVG